jgi:hypothetical protein
LLRVSDTDFFETVEEADAAQDHVSGKPAVLDEEGRASDRFTAASSMVPF